MDILLFNPSLLCIIVNHNLIFAEHRCDVCQLHCFVYCLRRRGEILTAETHIYIHRLTHSHTQTNTHTYRQTHIHTRQLHCFCRGSEMSIAETLIYTYRHTNTHTYAYTDTHIQTHTHTHSSIVLFCLLSAAGSTDVNNIDNWLISIVGMQCMI